MPEQPKSEVTLEQLLRLKRAEKPSEEFWQRFEQDFQRRRLQALLHRESWWHRLLGSMARFSYAAVPVGVTAVLAIGFMAFHGGLPAGKNGSVTHTSNASDLVPADVSGKAETGALAATMVSLARPSEGPVVTPEPDTLLFPEWPSTGMMDSRFVIDALPVIPDSPQRFRTVRHTPVFQVNPVGPARYVADPLRSGDAAALVPAALSASSHF